MRWCGEARDFLMARVAGATQRKARAVSPMLIISLVLGIVLGLLAGGQIMNLASVRLRFVQLLFLGLALRYMTQFAIEGGIAFANDFRLPLFAGGLRCSCSPGCG